MSEFGLDCMKVTNKFMSTFSNNFDFFFMKTLICPNLKTAYNKAWKRNEHFNL